MKPGMLPEIRTDRRWAIECGTAVRRWCSHGPSARVIEGDMNDLKDRYLGALLGLA
jgi:hypothetical protein